MDIYASDEEKSEEIKRWWRENGLSVVVGIALGAAVLFGGRFWLSYQQTQAEQAANIYQQTLVTLSDGDTALAESSVRNLISNFSGTPYAAFAAMEIASRYAAEDEVEAAREYLQWVIDNAELTAQQELARLRMARLLVDADKLDEALALVQLPVGPGYQSLFEEIKGDIHAARDEKTEAYSAYEAAIASVQRSDPRQTLLEMKRNEVAVNNDF